MTVGINTEVNNKTKQGVFPTINRPERCTKITNPRVEKHQIIFDIVVHKGQTPE